MTSRQVATHEQDRELGVSVEHRGEDPLVLVPRMPDGRALATDQMVSLVSRSAQAVREEAGAGPATQDVVELLVDLIQRLFVVGRRGRSATLQQMGEFFVRLLVVTLDGPANRHQLERGTNLADRVQLGGVELDDTHSPPRV